MLAVSYVFGLILVALCARAQSPAWGQCGGIGWSEATTCVSGYTCTVNNDYYSQCIPGTAEPSPSPSPTSSTAGGTSPPPSSTVSGPAPTGSQIRTVENPVYHFYLQNNGGVPALGPESSSGYFTLGSSISLNNADGSNLFLNINQTSTSYKPLTLGTTATTTNWGLEGDTIITVSPRQLNFLACSTSNPSFYDVFLQTGNDSPAGRSCSMATMHLPCLYHPVNAAAMTGNEKYLPTTRGYQQEMLDESLRNNIIIALDTGSGKTHIAILRIKAEVEHHSTKVSWFLAPTVTLCEQQKNVLAIALPAAIGFISGASEPDQWKDKALWESLLKTNKVVVSTPQVLLNAMRHGYVSMGRDISLIVFDEAHHAVRDEPYNQIMREFYFFLPARVPGIDYRVTNVRPMILGLTASPIYGGNVEHAFRTLETNLDATIRSPRIHRQELTQHVYRPTFHHVTYKLPEPGNLPFSTNLAALSYLVNSLKIEQDPYVKFLRKRLAELPNQAPERFRLDQQLSKAIYKNDTFCQRGLRDFERSADAILMDIGAWAADCFIYEVMQGTKRFSDDEYSHIFFSWKDSEKNYLRSQLLKLKATPISYDADDIVDDVTHKFEALVARLLKEQVDADNANEAFSGIVFVQRRDAVYALAMALTHHPSTKGRFRIGCLVGSSENPRRHSFLDITRTFSQQKQHEILMDFKLGEKNLLISTSVAEEGIDIQACGSVIRWDLPPNMPSWAQSRGRARKKRSSFTLMFPDDGLSQKSIQEWELQEHQMIALYNSERKRREDLLKQAQALEVDEDGEEEDLCLRVESTGAVLTLLSAVGHLEHFCAVIPTTSHASHQPLYEVDPPDMPEGWHAFETKTEIKPPTGPFGATVILPKILAPELRVFRVPKIYNRKVSAQRHVAFKAYKALYEAGMLNDHLLPITSVAEPQLADEVKSMLKDVEKRAGMASVSLQMDPWVPDWQGTSVLSKDMEWRVSKLEIEDLPPLTLFTRRRLPVWDGTEGPTLYQPGSKPVRVRLIPTEETPSADVIEKARLFTRRMFWCIHGARMEWDNLDFRYLFLPVGAGGDVWDSRRDWVLQEMHGVELAKVALFANARLFGDRFGYPEDISLVRMGQAFDKPCQFVGWKSDQMTEEEEVQYMLRYAKTYEPGPVEYPLLIVRSLPPRTNFLLPLPPVVAKVKETILDPWKSSIALVSQAEVDFSTLMPSVVRAAAMSITVQSLRDILFNLSPLQAIPADLLAVAITAPVSQERYNYQRLETLGDTVLKFTAAIQLLNSYPLWHEGYLTKKKDHSVSNVRLAKCAVKKQLYSWIIRNRMLGKKWAPDYFSVQRTVKVIKATVAPMQVDSASQPSSPLKSKGGKKRRRGKGNVESHELSTKADVVESLIGAAYEHGGFDLGLECIRLFDIGLALQPFPVCFSAMLSRVEPDREDMPTQLSSVEKMIGYTFRRKFLLVEALSHASHQENNITVSYERMEFLGDSVLDMIVTDYLYHAPGKTYSPGHMHLRRSALVNAHTLAFICLRTHTSIEVEMPQTRGQGKVSSHPG
ncbi:hypothetical protein ONZ45_g17069 [Pleurotus djamor]|nr:hypothetical protein ONZ45_g17069 [Pleurotus djamor]